MKTYYVESWAGWFVTFARNKRHAKSEGAHEWGRGCVKAVREATKDEVDYYAGQRGGMRALEPST